MLSVADAGASLSTQHSLLSTYRAAFCTLPLRMHRVQTERRRTVPSTIARTRCRFGIQRRLETLWAWLIRFPNTGALPQTSHILAMIELPQITRKAQILIVQ